MTKEEYFQKYATLNENGIYYYKQNNKNDFKLNNKSIPQGFWEGPHGVLVSNKTNCIVAKDGLNDLYQDGTETKMYWEDVLTKEEYLQDYAKLGADGFYYYKK
jgi:hypothetical protein